MHDFAKGEQRYPKPDRSNFVPDRHTVDDVMPERDIGSHEGTLTDGRPFRSEIWCREGTTFLTFFFSTIELDDATDADLLKLVIFELRRNGIPEARQKIDPNRRRIVDASGNEMFTVTFLAGESE